MTMSTSVTATPIGSATDSQTSSGSAASSSGTQSPIFTLAIELAGVVALSIIASIGPKTGRVIVLFMVGILVLWLVLNASTLAKLIPGTNVAVQGLWLVYRARQTSTVWQCLVTRPGWLKSASHTAVG